MYKRNDQLQVTVTDAAFEGGSIARVENFVVFVDGSVPGDVATVRILKAKKNYAEAKIVTLDTPSPLRVVPRCSHAGVCGGCKWQHVEYAAQLKFKQQQVVDSFQRIGGFTDVPILPIIGSDEQFFYRNKMEFSFSEKEWLTTPPPEEGPKERVIGHYLGLHVPQRFDKVLDIEACFLQSDVSNKILHFTRDFAKSSGLAVYSSDQNAGYWRFLVIRQTKHTAQLMVNVVTFEDKPAVMNSYTESLVQEFPLVTTVVNTINARRSQIAVGESERACFGSGVIHEQLGPYKFEISASSFFQTNTLQAEKLYGVAKDFAELKASDTVWDLYSGTGSIALFVSDVVTKVVGVESMASAVNDAKRNAEQNGVSNCEFVLGDLKDRLTKDTGWMSSHARPDVMIIDPPRSGMHQKVVEEILSIAPERIVYVSCNPATQARDIKLLCADRYRLVRLQPVDMFPHTYHIENVAQLRLR